MPDVKPEGSQKSTAEYANYARSEKPVRNWTRIISVLIIIVLILGAGAGVYEYLKKHKTVKSTLIKTTQAKPATVVTTTNSYTSQDLFLTFSYPSNWTIVDTGTNNMLTATSPLIQLKASTGQEVNGKIVMTILGSATALPGFTAGNDATAVLPSLNITYKQPTQDQRASTYVSFLTYASTVGSNALDAIYISGNNGYTLGQDIPQSDLLQVSPIISLTFLNSTGKPLTISASEWSDSSFSTPLLNMLKSLSIT